MKDSGLSFEENLDPEFVAIVEDITARLLAGEQISPLSLATEYPQYASELAKMISTMTAAADWGDSVAKASWPVSQAGVSDGVAENHRPLGDFRLIREIGRGGMGIVYEAEQLSLSRRVALKVLPLAAMLDEKQRKRFQHEARSAAMLRHPHIVGVHAVGCERGVHFYAMDLIDGHSLAETISQLQEGRASDGDSLRAQRPDSETAPIAALSTEHTKDRRAYYRSIAKLVIQAAGALHFAHQEGVVHRDIKPSNLLLDGRGKLHVADFGLAMSQNGDGLTLTGDLIGTLRYMSPEQVAGSPTLVDHRTDIYSLGATLYELLTLRPAFEAKDRPLLLRQIDEKNPPALRAIDAAIPKDLETVVMKAMAKDRHDRYASAADLKEDLHRFLELKPINARRSTRLQKVGRWAKRNPALSIISGLATTLILGIAVVGPIVAVRYNVLLPSYAPANYSSSSSFTTPRWLLPNGSTLVSGSEESAMRFWNPERDDEVSELRGHDDAVVRLAVSRNSRLLASTSWDGSAGLWDVQTAERRATFRRPPESKSQHLYGLDISPDGHTVAIGGGLWRERGIPVGLWLWDTDSNSSRTLFSAPLPNTTLVSAVAFSPRGDQLAASIAKSIHIYDVENGQLELKLKGHTDIVCGLAWSRAGDLIASMTMGPTRELKLWRGVDGDLLAHLPMPGPLSDICFSLDGELLAVGTDGGDVHLLDLATRQVVRTLVGHTNVVRGVDFSSDGRRLATASLDTTVRIWNVASGNALVVLNRPTGPVWDVKFTPDGTALFAADRSVIRVWRAAEDQQVEE